MLEENGRVLMATTTYTWFEMLSVYYERRKRSAAFSEGT